MEPIVTAAIIAPSMYFILIGIFSRIDMNTYGHSYSFHFMWNLSLTYVQIFVCYLSVLFVVTAFNLFVL